MFECCKKFWARCLAEDAPVFTLVAWDKTAIETVRFWIRTAKENRVNEEKVMRAYAHMALMEEYQRNNPDKVKLPD